MKLPSFTGYCSHFNVERVLFTLPLPAMTEESLIKKDCAIKEADVVCQSLNKYEKLLWFYVIHYCVFFIKRNQLFDKKIGRPKKIAGSLSDPKKDGSFGKPKTIAQKLANAEK